MNQTLPDGTPLPTSNGNLGLMSETQNKYWLGRVVDGDIMFGPFSEQRAGFSGLADMKAGKM